MVLKPQLQKQGGEESEKATEALDRLINFLKKRLDLSRKEKKMNILLAHLRKHPGFFFDFYLFYFICLFIYFYFFSLFIFIFSSFIFYFF